MRLVQLPTCAFCTRAIFPTGKADQPWVHGTGRAECYSSDGTKNVATPRAPR